MKKNLRTWTNLIVFTLGLSFIVNFSAPSSMASQTDIVDIKEAHDAGIVSLTFTGAQNEETLKINIKKVLQVPLIIEIPKGSTAFAHQYGEISIVLQDQMDIDLAKNMEDSVIVNQAGKGRMKGEMSIRKRFSGKTSALYAKLKYSKEVFLSQLLATLKDEDPWIRGGAVDAIGAIGDSSMESYLENIANNDKDSGVRTKAKEALNMNKKTTK